MKLLKALRLEVKLIAYHYIRKALNLYWAITFGFFST
jgi:hypothetical protein